MQPMQPGGSYRAPVQAPQKKSGGAAGWMLLIGGCGCFGLLAAVGAIGLGFFLVNERKEEAYVAPEPWEPQPVDPYAPSPADPPPAGLAEALEGPERYRVTIAPDDPVRGPSDAPVTIVEFGNFQCPFCARATGTLEELERLYPGQIRIVWKDNPLAHHTDAMPAALAAAEARAQQGDAAFWRMHDLLFENTRALSRPDLERHARALGLDLRRFRNALDMRTHATAIGQDQALAGQIGATGTPTFYINGRELRGAQPLSAFRSIVDEELAHARRVEQGGVPRARLYDEIIRNGRTSPAPSEPAAAAPRVEDDDDRVHRVPVGDSPQRGPDDALVTIVAFSDFQCPFCARVTGTLDQIERRYGGDVRIVFKHNPLPFHREAMPAAQAAVEVHRQRGDEAFWRMHDLMFENTRALSNDDLVRYARRAGASGTQVLQALQRDTHRAVVQRDMDLAAEVGVRGTPTFFINGKKLAGAQPFERFQEVIDRELAAARALVARGTPRARVYDTILATAP